MGHRWGHEKLKAEVGKMFAAGGFVEAGPEVRTASKVRWGIESLRTKGLEDGKTASSMWPEFVAKQLNGEEAIDIMRALPKTAEWLVRLQSEGIVDLSATEYDIVSELLWGCFWESNAPRREKGEMYFRSVWESAKERAQGNNESLKRCLNYCTLADFINVVIDLSVENLRTRLADYLTLFERQGDKKKTEATLNSVAIMFKVSGSTSNRIRPKSILPVALRISNDVYRSEINMQFTCTSEIEGKINNLSAEIAVEVNLAAHEMLRSLTLTKSSPGYFNVPDEDINKMEDVAFDVLLKHVDLDAVDESEDYSTMNKAVLFPMLCLAGVKPSSLKTESSIEMWQSVMAGVFQHCARLGGIFQKLEQRYHFVECFSMALKAAAYGSLKGDAERMVIAIFAWMETKPERMILSKPEEFLRREGSLGMTHEMLDKTLGLSAQMIYVTTMLKKEGEPMDVTYAFMPFVSALNGLRGGRFRSRRIFPSGWLMYNLTRDIVWEEEDKKTMLMATAFGVPEDEAMIMLLGMTSLRDLTERMALVDDTCEEHIRRFFEEAGLVNVTDTNAVAVACLMYRAAFEHITPSNLWSEEDDDFAFTTKMSMSCMDKLSSSAKVGDIQIGTAEAIIEELASIGEKVSADIKMTADFQVKCRYVTEKAERASRKALNKLRRFKSAKDHPYIRKIESRAEKASLRLIETKAAGEKGGHEEESKKDKDEDAASDARQGEKKQQEAGTEGESTYADIVKRDKVAKDKKPEVEGDGGTSKVLGSQKPINEDVERNEEEVTIEDASEDEEDSVADARIAKTNDVTTVIAKGEETVRKANEIGRMSVEGAIIHPGGSPQTLADFNAIITAFPKKPSQLMNMEPVDTEKCLISKDGVIYPPTFSRVTYRSGDQTLASCSAVSQVMAGVGGEKSTLVMGSATLLDSMGFCFKAASTLDMKQFANNLKKFVGTSKIAWGASDFLRSEEVLKIDGNRVALEIAKQIRSDLEMMERAQMEIEGREGRLNEIALATSRGEEETSERYWKFESWNGERSIDLLNREEVEGQREWMKAIIERAESLGKMEFTTTEAVRMCAAARELARFYPIKKKADLDLEWNREIFESMVLRATFTKEDFRSCMDVGDLVSGRIEAASTEEDAKLYRAIHEEAKLKRKLLVGPSDEIVEEEPEASKKEELKQIAKEMEKDDTRLLPVVRGITNSVERFVTMVAEGMTSIFLESDIPLKSDTISGSLMIGTKARTIATYGMVEAGLILAKESECLTAALVNAALEVVIRTSSKVRIEMEEKEGRLSFAIGFPAYLISEVMKIAQVIYNLTARLTNCASQWAYQTVSAARRLDESYRAEYVSSMMVGAMRNGAYKKVKTLELLTGGRLEETEREIFGNLAQAEEKLEERTHNFKKTAKALVSGIGMVVGLPFAVADFFLASMAARTLRLSRWFIGTARLIWSKSSEVVERTVEWTADKIDGLSRKQTRVLKQACQMFRKVLKAMSIASLIYDLEVEEEYKVGSEIGEAQKKQTAILSEMVNKLTNSVASSLAEKIIGKRTGEEKNKRIEEDKKKNAEIEEKRSAYAMLSNSSKQIETDAETEVWKSAECEGRVTCLGKNLLIVHAPAMIDSDLEVAKKQKMLLLGTDGVTFCVTRTGTQIVSPKVGNAGSTKVGLNKTNYVVMEKGLLRVSSVDMNGRHTRGTATLLFNVKKETEELFTVEHLRGCGGAFKIGELRDEVVCLCVNHKTYDLDLADVDVWDVDEQGQEAQKNLKLRAESVISSVSEDYVFAICPVGDYRGLSGAAVEDRDGGFIGINLAQVTLDGKDRIPGVNRSAIILGVNMEDEAPIISLPHQTVVECHKCMIGDYGDKSREGKHIKNEAEGNSERKKKDRKSDSGESKHKEDTESGEEYYESLEISWNDGEDGKDNSRKESTGALALVCEKTAASKAEVAGTYSLKIAYNVVGEMLRDMNSIGLRDRSVLLLRELEQAIINNRSLVICCDSNAAETTVAAWLSCLRMPFRRATHMGTVHALAAESDENFTFSCSVISAETVVTDFIRGGQLMTYRRDKTCRVLVLTRPDGFKPDVMATVYGFAYGLTENVLTIPLGAKEDEGEASGAGVWIKTDDKCGRKNQGTNNILSLVKLQPSGKRQIKSLTDVDVKVFMLTTEVHSTYMHRLREQFAIEHSVSVMNVTVGNSAVLSGSVGLTNLAAADMLVVSSATFENPRKGEDRLACVWDRTMSDCETEMIADALRMAAVVNDLDVRFRVVSLVMREFSPRDPLRVEAPDRIKMKRKNRIEGEDVGRDELFKKLSECQTRGCSYMMDPKTITSKLSDRMKNPAIASTILSKAEVLTGDAIKVTEMDQGWLWTVKLKINDAKGSISSKIARALRWMSRKVVNMKRMVDRTVLNNILNIRDKVIRMIGRVSAMIRDVWKKIIGKNTVSKRKEAEDDSSVASKRKSSEAESKMSEKDGTAEKCGGKPVAERLRDEGRKEKQQDGRPDKVNYNNKKKKSWADQVEDNPEEETTVTGNAEKRETGTIENTSRKMIRMIKKVAGSMAEAIKTGVGLAMVGPRLMLFAVRRMAENYRDKMVEVMDKTAKVMRSVMPTFHRLKSRFSKCLLTTSKVVAAGAHELRAGKKSTAKTEDEDRKEKKLPMKQMATIAVKEARRRARTAVSNAFKGLRESVSAIVQTMKNCYDRVRKIWTRVYDEITDLCYHVKMVVGMMVRKKTEAGKRFCMFRRGEAGSTETLVMISRSCFGMIGRAISACIVAGSYTVDALALAAFVSLVTEPVAYVMRRSDWILPNVIMWISDYLSYAACIGEVGMWIAGKVALIKIGRRAIAIGALYDAAAGLAAASTSQVDLHEIHANIAERITVGKRSTSIVIMNEGPIWTLIYATGNVFISMVNIFKKTVFSYKIKRMMVWMLDSIRGRSTNKGPTGVVKVVPLYSIYDGVGIFAFMSAAVVTAAAIANRMAEEDAAVIGVLAERKHTADNINVYMENREAYNIALRASAIGVASYMAYCGTTTSIIVGAAIGVMTALDWIIASRNRTGYTISVAHALIRLAAYPWPLAILDAVNLMVLDNEDCAPSSISMLVSTGKVVSKEEFEEITSKMMEESEKFMIREKKALQILTDLKVTAGKAVKESRKKLLIEHEIEDLVTDVKWKMDHDDRKCVLSFKGQDIGLSKTEEEKPEGHKSLGELESLFKNQMRYVGRLTFLDKREQEDDREVRAEMSKQQSRLLLSEDLWKGVIKKGAETEFDAARDARQDVLFALAERNDCPVNKEPGKDAVRGFCARIVTSVYMDLKMIAEMNMPASGIDWAVIAADANDKATSGIIDRHRSGLPLIASYLPRKKNRVKAVRDMLMDCKAKGGEVAANVFAKRRVEKKKRSRLTGEKIVVTRTIQAHETEMKMVELSLFSVMDKMFKMMRFRNNMSLGINHFGEFAEDDLVQMTEISRTKDESEEECAWRVSLDHSSYDAQQRLWAIEAVRVLRERIVEEVSEDKAVAKSLVALMRRIYETNRLRPFLTPSGDLLYVCGQQMTGHATTSSDNSLRALGYVGGAAKVAEEKKVVVVDRSIRVQGDDTVFGVTASRDLSKEDIKTILIEAFEESGMVLKTEKINVTEEDGPCDFLSHWCEETHIMVEYEGGLSMNRTLWRPIRKRSDIAEMLPTSLRSAVSGKRVSQASLLASKALSFTYMYGAFGDLVIYCAVAFFAAMATIKKMSLLGPKAIRKIKDNLPWLITHGGELTKIKCDVGDIIKLHEMEAKTAASKFKGWWISMGQEEVEIMRRAAIIVHNIIEMFPRMPEKEKRPLIEMTKWIGTATLAKTGFLEVGLINDLIKAQGEIEIDIEEHSVTYEPWSMFKWENALFYPNEEPEKVVIINESTDVLISVKDEVAERLLEGLREFKTEEIRRSDAMVFKAGGLAVNLVARCLIIEIRERRWIVVGDQSIIEKSDMKRERKIAVMYTEPSEAIREANKIVERVRKKPDQAKLMSMLSGDAAAVIAMSELLRYKGIMSIDEALNMEACGSVSPIEWGIEGRRETMRNRIETYKRAEGELSARVTMLFIERGSLGGR